MSFLSMLRPAQTPLAVARSIVLAIALVLIASVASSASAQTRFKVNAVTTLLGVPSVGWERVIGPRRSVQLDVTASLWRSVDHAPFQFLLIVPEWRHHFRDGQIGPYVGLHAGLVGFRLQKWDKLTADRYQEGFGVVFGGTVGYQQRMSERLTLDWYVGGGTAQSKYKGYEVSTGDRYDGETGWNESGEWLPYRGGIMLSYRLR